MRAAAPRRVVVVGSYAESLVKFRGPLLRSLVDRGHSVVACAPAIPTSVRTALQELGVDCRDIPLARTGLNPLRDLRTLWALVAVFRKVEPDVILAYTIKPVVYGSLAARLAGVAAVYSLITGLGYAFTGRGPKQRLVGGLARRLYRVGLARNRAVFFQNPDDLALFTDRALLKEPDRAVLVNGSGVDVEFFRPEALPAEVSFLLIARLLGDKGVREYAAAARTLRRKYPGAVFRLAGWRDENPSCIGVEELAAWRKEGAIDFLGRLEDVRPALAASAVYVLPSYREGTPRTVLEAMAMGRAVVTTDAPGCRETVRDGWNGFLVPVRNATALAAAMEKFIQDPSLAAKMGAASRWLAEEKYDVHKVNRVMLKAMDLA